MRHSKFTRMCARPRLARRLFRECGPLPSELLRHGGCVGILAGTDLPREEHGVDVGDDTASGDDDVGHVLVQLLVRADGKLDVPRDDAVLLLVLRGVARELQDLGGDVLDDGGHEDGAFDSDSLRVASSLQLLREAANRKDEPRARLQGLIPPTLFLRRKVRLHSLLKSALDDLLHLLRPPDALVALLESSLPLGSGGLRAVLVLLRLMLFLLMIRTLLLLINLGGLRLIVLNALGHLTLKVERRDCECAHFRKCQGLAGVN
mmetsp:Transcript_75047/g.243964  ORF Transcript_75047/g.243964 Transcript_75047/m.243964 type:complete len:262 (+) Transcript_75047:60-845(+)